MSLTPKERRFVEEYLVDLNATQAAIRASFSARSARQTAARMLSKDYIQAAIAEAKAERAERTGVTAEKVITHLWEIASADPNDLVQFRRVPCEACHEGDQSPDLEPRADCPSCHGEGEGRTFFQDTRSLTGPARRLYAGIKQTRDGLQVLMRSQDSALGLLFDHLGLHAPRRSELTGKDGGPIETAPLADELASLTPEQRASVRTALQAALTKKA